MQIELPETMTLGELAERFPIDRFRLVRKPDGSIRVEERDSNGALRHVGAARIIRNAANPAVNHH